MGHSRFACRDFTRLSSILFTRLWVIEQIDVSVT
ncbi:hypothetical protein OOU_Y34scaffold00516g54 [Pyricularia oryzae Y34]|uniref:Uncharacterized protein n=2 Tax=Pyricularia oryzae TaxID=318829 RepID=A0AA97PLL3_PYRO3|nr:hypothetical protein OOU_Y34scaffold00516g54 [Pyricularia oryzae Y34]